MVTSGDNAAVEVVGVVEKSVKETPQATTNYWIPLIIFCILYLLFEILILIANHHKHSKMKDVQCFQSALASHANVNAFIANSLYKFTKRFVNQRKNNQTIPLQIVKDIAGFQEFAFAVCKDIYDVIKDLFKCEQPQVTVFQKFTNTSGDKHIQMIAYGTFNNVIPSSYSEPYILSGSLERFDEKIFGSKEAKIRTLHNKDAVRENFKISEHSKAREEAICQYIGVPIKDSSGEIVFLLQIDVNEENTFGKSELALKELAENVFFPFAQLLYATYEHERMLETLHASINII